MDKEELKRRTKAAAIKVIKLAERLPRNAAGFEIAKANNKGCNVCSE